MHEFTSLQYLYQRHSNGEVVLNNFHVSFIIMFNIAVVFAAPVWKLRIIGSKWMWCWNAVQSWYWRVTQHGSVDW